MSDLLKTMTFVNAKVVDNCGGFICDTVWMSVGRAVV